MSLSDNVNSVCSRWSVVGLRAVVVAGPGGGWARSRRWRGAEQAPAPTLAVPLSAVGRL